MQQKIGSHRNRGKEMKKDGCFCKNELTTVLSNSLDEKDARLVFETKQRLKFSVWIFADTVLALRKDIVFSIRKFSLMFGFC